MAKKKITEVEPDNRPGKNILRKPTGLFSFDMACSGGLPMYSITELSGPAHSGKSTLAAFLCGAVAAPDKTIALLDIETFDKEYPIQSANLAGWSGKMVQPPDLKDGKPLFQEDMMDSLVDMFIEDESITSVMVDSIGAFRPAAEFEGSVGDAVMGKRAQVVGRFMGKMARWLRIRPAHMVCVNHVHQKLGTIPGTNTSGGVAMQYFPAVRADVWAKRDDTHWTLNGEVFKLRYRNHSLPFRKSFKVIILPGIGVHKGLTAVEDAVLLGLAERDKVIKIDGKSYGYFAKMVEQQEDDELFKPFIDRLSVSAGLRE